MIKILGTCPICNGNIIEKEHSYGCTNSDWKFCDTFNEWQNTGCTYSIYKETLKKYGKKQ